MTINPTGSSSTTEVVTAPVNGHQGFGQRYISEGGVDTITIIITKP